MNFLQIFFCKYPQEGKVKTRLSRTIGKVLSTQIYKNIILNNITQFPEESTIIYLDPESFHLEKQKPFFAKFLSHYAIFLQKGNDLGVRMANAFKEAIKKFPDQEMIFLAGSDIPDYNFKKSLEIFESFKNTDKESIIVPSEDGGYSMIGFRKKCIQMMDIEVLFMNISWSSSMVLEQQMKNLSFYRISYFLTPPLNDLDTYQDLKKMVSKHYIANIIKRVYVLIPVLNESDNLKILLPKILTNPFVKEVIVIDNGSTDNSMQVAKSQGATVISCPQKGYGNAMQKGIFYLKNQNLNSDHIVLFMDGDGSDDPDEIENLVIPLFRNEADFVLGDRTRSSHLLFHQKLGNWLATFWIRILWNYSYSDLGPMRAIFWKSLLELQMQDPDFGWTIEMQIKAVQHQLRIQEIPVRYHRRMSGKSKVSGTIKGSFLAGWVILTTIFKEWWRKK